MPSSTENCKQVSSTCPVEATIYGYAPNLAGNAIYAVIFAICALSHIFFTFKHWRVWKGYTILLCIGSIGECCGYIGRLFLHNNPWNGAAMPIQFVLLMVSPSFLAAALYMTLKQLVYYFGPEHTKLPARFWTWPFVTADTIGFLLQCGGGIVSATAELTPALGIVGTALMITGVTLQAVVMAIAGFLATNFSFRFRRQHNAGVFAASSRKMCMFLSAMAVAFVLILTRCIYRIPELAGGVGGALMREETEFMIFDGLMIVISVILLTMFHPGQFARELQGCSTEKAMLRAHNSDNQYEMLSH